jgi:hypothetical protein
MSLRILSDFAYINVAGTKFPILYLAGLPEKVQRDSAARVFANGPKADQVWTPPNFNSSNPVNPEIRVNMERCGFQPDTVRGRPKGHRCHLRASRRGSGRSGQTISGILHYGA